MGKPHDGLHANRQYSTPWISAGPRNCMSRSDILTKEESPTITHWTTGQNVGDISGEKYAHPAIWPSQGRLLRVPKTVMLSSLPNWSLMWERDVFYGTRDIIGQMFTPPYLFGNYYYFEQWDTIQDSAQLMTGNFDVNDPRFSNGGIWDQGLVQQTKDSLSQHAQALFNGTPPVDGPDQFADGSVGQYFGTRFHQVIGEINNRLPAIHRQIMSAFLQAQQTLLALQEPIYAIVPEWFPSDVKQVRNGYLTETVTKHNDAHNTNPCVIFDSIPCDVAQQQPWGPAYPNKNDPRNEHAFTQPTVPWLMSQDPGFGTNFLHLYCGHAMHRYSPSTAMFEAQAYPLLPEGQFIGPEINTNYLGNPLLPYYAGRRAIWRDAGFLNGYSVGIPGLYRNYESLISGAAAKLRENFFKYRNHNTVLGTYSGNPFPTNWHLYDISKDQRADCPATSFYFGNTFAEWQAHSTEDSWYVDCSNDPTNPLHLKLSANYTRFPTNSDIQTALSTFYPPIQKRVDLYYTGIQPGTMEYFKYVIQQQKLDEVGVSTTDAIDYTDPDSIVDYVRTYFG